MNEKLETIGVRLPKKVVASIRQLAKSREWTVSQTARKLIEQALNNGAKETKR